VPIARRLQPWLALALLAALACALYLPYVGNPLVYDDRGFFVGARFAEHAMSPFGYKSRGLSYFSIAFIEVMWARIEAHRLASLLMHILTAWSLYALLRALQRVTAGTEHVAPPLVGAALFAVHPVAVYAAAYLAQRATVLATLFVLLSLLMYLRGLRSGSYGDALVAALLYSAAIMSKESAIIAPAAALALIPLVKPPRAFALRYTALYFAACLPAAVLIIRVALAVGVVGQAYEPQFDAVAAQAAADAGGVPGHPLLASGLAQAGLFWRHLASWIWPRTELMSFDLRIGLAGYWSAGVATAAVVAFAGSAAAAAAFVRRGGRAGMAAFGFLYLWIMFLVEFAAVRFQEPFQLYRGYLWAPGLAIMLASVLPARKLLLIACLPLLALLGWQAHDRLNSFSSGLALWEDAAAKLPREPVPGGHRALYELGREYLHAERNQDAVRVVQRCLKLYPAVYDCQFAMGAINLHLGEDEAALPYFEKAIELRPKEFAARVRLGQALENLGCIDEAKAHYRAAQKGGYAAAEHYLQRLESPGKGLLPPRASAPTRATRCPCCRR
jgi:tetratricopeptide (TPR) repeat protein